MLDLVLIISAFQPKKQKKIFTFILGSFHVRFSVPYLPNFGDRIYLILSFFMRNFPFF